MLLLLKFCVIRNYGRRGVTIIGFWNALSEVENQMERLTDGLISNTSSFLTKMNLFIPIEIFGRMGRCVEYLFVQNSFFLILTRFPLYELPR